MATFDTWESYFYPPPDDATMRNVQDIRDPQALQVFEYGATALRQKQLYMDPSIVARTYDAAHVRSIHRHLFQDVYEWAGEYRTQNMTKVGRVTRSPLSASYPQSPSQATGRPTSGPQQQRGSYRPGQGYGAGPQGAER